jgi:hypothetical protein
MHAGTSHAAIQCASRSDDIAHGSDAACAVNQIDPWSDQLAAATRSASGLRGVSALA